MRFRWQWALVVVVCLIVAWVVSTVRPASSWDGVMNAMNVHHKAEYTQMMVLGLAICAILGIWRVLRRNDEDEP